MNKCILDFKSGKVAAWTALQLASYTLLDTPVEFQQEGHIYTFDGRNLPSTTGILKDEGFIDGTWFTEKGRERGTDVHDLIKMEENGEWFDEDVIEAEVINRLNAWRKFKQETGFVVEQSEIPMMSKAYQFAGTPDAIGYFPTGNLKRAAVELHKDGTYRIYQYNDRQDVNIWLSALAVYNWKLNNLKK